MERRNGSAIAISRSFRGGVVEVFAASFKELAEFAQSAGFELPDTGLRDAHLISDLGKAEGFGLPAAGVEAVMVGEQLLFALRQLLHDVQQVGVGMSAVEMFRG